jgi:hypothetical protein
MVQDEAKEIGYRNTPEDLNQGNDRFSIRFFY